MKKVIYLLILQLVVVSGLVFAGHEIKKEASKKSTPKPLSAAEMKAALHPENAADLKLLESRIERLPTTLRITHVFEHTPTGARLLSEPYTGYD